MIELYGLSGRFLMEREVNLGPTSELEAKLKQIPEGTKVGIGFLAPEDRREVDEMLELCSFSKFPQNYMVSSSYFDRIMQVCSSCDHDVSWLGDKDLWLRYFGELKRIGIMTREITELVGESKKDSSIEIFRKKAELSELAYENRVVLAKNHLINIQGSVLEKIDAQSLRAFVGDVIYTDNVNLRRNMGGIVDFEGSQYVADVLVNPSQPVLIFEGAIAHNVGRDDGFGSLRKAINLVERGSFYDGKPDWVGTTNPTAPSDSYFEIFIEGENSDGIYGRIEELNAITRFEEGVLGPEVVRFKKLGDSKQKGDSMIFKSDDCLCIRESHRGVISHGKSNGGLFYIETFGGRNPIEMCASWDNLPNSPKGQLRLFR